MGDELLDKLRLAAHGQATDVEHASPERPLIAVQRDKQRDRFGPVEERADASHEFESGSPKEVYAWPI